MRAGIFCLAGFAGLLAAAAAPQPGSAQEVNQIVRNLNAILNPQDAVRLEERARREGRADEERYWRDYRAGLEHRPPGREESYAPRYGEGERRHEIRAEEARRLEEQARRDRRFEDARYWRDYRAGLESRPGYDRPASDRPASDRPGYDRPGSDRPGSDRPRYAIGPDEARRFEEQSRRNHRLEEERYWRDYRAGLEGRPRQ